MTTTTGICPSPCSVFFFFCCWLIGGGGRGSSSTLSAPLLLLLLQMVVWTMLFTRIPLTDALYCYECTSSGRGDRTCNRYVGTSCGYGFFGCIKIGMYSGGVNKNSSFSHFFIYPKSTPFAFSGQLHRRRPIRRVDGPWLQSASNRRG